MLNSKGIGESSSAYMQLRQTVLAFSISHREDEMETHIKGLQLGRRPASGEKRQLDPQTISILTLASHATFCTAQSSQGAASYGAAGGGRAALPGPSYVWKGPGRGCRQGRTEERISRDSTE